MHKDPVVNKNTASGKDVNCHFESKRAVQSIRLLNIKACKNRLTTYLYSPFSISKRNVWNRGTPQHI